MTGLTHGFPAYQTVPLTVLAVNMSDGERV